MTLKVKWIPASKEVELVVPHPKPAKLYIPEWYKKATPPASEKKYEFSSPGQVKNLGVKACAPFQDALTHGYIQETWTDIHFSISEDGESVLEYNYPVGPPIMSHRDASLKTNFLIPEGYYSNEFTWKEPWIPVLPDGYSMLYTTPLNNFSLPFLSVSAILDSDKYHHEYGGQAPFLLKKGFKGVVPCGTPMYVMIPIKRESWVSEALEFNHEDNLKKSHELRKYIANGYRKMFWQKKEFN
jgi:hypothetical protein